MTQESQADPNETSLWRGEASGLLDMNISHLLLHAFPSGFPLPDGRVLIGVLGRASVLDLCF